MEILDVCTGSGCILLSLLRYSNGCRGVGCDISEKALAVAGQNAKVLGISRTRSYELVNEKGFPKIKIGTRIVVPKDEFKLWIQKQIKKG